MYLLFLQCLCNQETKQFQNPVFPRCSCSSCPAILLVLLCDTSICPHILSSLLTHSFKFISQGLLLRADVCVLGRRFYSRKGSILNLLLN